MKKTFPLTADGKNPARLLEATKNEIRKYIKRERRRELPEGVDFWDFDCKFGVADADAVPVHLNDIIPMVDAEVEKAGTQFYVEILAKHGHRSARVTPPNETV